jgi:hypothetical protein
MALLVLLQINKSEKVNWRKNFETDSKAPFGLYIFNQESEFLLKNKLKKIENSPYNYYNENPNSKPHNILLIEKSIDEESWKKLMDEVSKGSDAMIVSEFFPYKVADSLKFTHSNMSYDDVTNLELTDVKFKNDKVILDKFPSNRGFMYISKEHEILGKLTATNSENSSNFIKINFGKGHFYVHSEPLFLTNYYLLKSENEKYAQDVFSYLPDRETVWFTENSGRASRIPIRFILMNPGLRYAWWLLLGGLLLFAIFNAKRRQRIVPIIEPLKNKSVEFVKSIGNLYLQEGDFHDMMAKKAQYFLHKVRMDLLIDTQNLDENFAKKLQLKTGKNIEKINEALLLIQKGNDRYSQVTREDLIKMNQILDEILKF